jgi:hypothetical protein
MKKSPMVKRLAEYDRVLFAESVVGLFWAAIKERRKSGKYPLQALADATGIDKGKISRDFSSAPNWRLSTVVDIANALDLDLEIRARSRETGQTLTPSGPVITAVMINRTGPMASSGPSFVMHQRVGTQG